MAMKRQSLKLHEIDWQVLMGIALDLGCEYRGQPSWRRLIDEIASGNLTVVKRPDKRVRDFQKEQKRRAAGIPPSGAQEALDEANGCNDGFGVLTGPQDIP